MNKKKILFFDFFGTLVSYTKKREDIDFTSTLALLNTHKHFTKEDFLKKWEKSFTQVQNEYTGEIEFSIEEVVAVFIQQHCSELSLYDFASTYMADWSGGVSYIENLDLLLSKLASSYKLAIISNTHYPQMVYDHLRMSGIDQHFDWVHLSAEVGYRKPSKKIFEFALSCARVNPSDALHIGDAYEDDFVGARNAGLECILVTEKRLDDVPYQVSDLFEIEGLLV